MKKIRIMLFAFICLFALGIYNVNAQSADTKNVDAEEVTNYGIFVNGKELTSSEKSVQAGEGTVSYDANKGELTLSNATIEATDATVGINITGSVAKEVKLVLVGENKIETATGDGILSAKNLTIGGGSLVITSTSGYSINMSADELTINDATLKLTTSTEKSATVNATTIKYGELGSKKVFASTNVDGSEAVIIDTATVTSLATYKNVSVETGYTVSVENDKNSTVELSSEDKVFRKGDKVEATVVALDSYKLVSVLVNDKTVEVKEGKVTITVEKDTVIKVTSIAKAEIATIAPTVDTKKEVKEVAIGVKTDDKTNATLKAAISKKSINVEDVANVEVAVLNKKAEDVDKKVVEGIASLLTEKKMNLANYFDITLNVKKVDGTVDTLTNLDNALTFQVALPTSLTKTNKNVKRTFYVIRYHDSKAEVLNTSLSSNVLTFASDKFSTYAIAYTDEAVKDTSKATSNPDTGDNVITYALTSVLCVSGLLGTGVILRKRFN